MNPEQWLSLKWNGGSTMSDRWLNQSKIIQLGYQDIKTSLKNENSYQKTQQNARERTIRISRCENAFVQYFTVKFRHLYIYF